MASKVAFGRYERQDDVGFDARFMRVADAERKMRACSDPGPSLISDFLGLGRLHDAADLFDLHGAPLLLLD